MWLSIERYTYATHIENNHNNNEVYNSLFLIILLFRILCMRKEKILLHVLNIQSRIYNVIDHHVQKLKVFVKYFEVMSTLDIKKLLKGYYAIYTSMSWLRMWWQILPRIFKADRMMLCIESDVELGTVFRQR